MKYLNLKTLILLISLGASSTALAAPSADSVSRPMSRGYFSDSELPADVQAAHDAFLQGNFNALGAALKVALMGHPGDEMIQRNLLDLYDKAYAVKGDGAILPDWKAPEGVNWMGVGAQRKVKPIDSSVHSRVTFGMDFRRNDVLEQLQVIRYPSRVLMDLQAKMGEFEITEENGELNLWSAQDYQSTPVEEGLYLLEIKFKGKETVHGWFVLSQMNVDDSPVVKVPTQNQIFETRTPTFAWEDYVSSKYRPFEKRKVSVAVVSRRPETRSNSWSQRDSSVGFQSATVGSGAHQESGMRALIPDAYVFQVHYREHHHFGDLQIERRSSTQVPFEVK